MWPPMILRRNPGASISIGDNEATATVGAQVLTLSQVAVAILAAVAEQGEASLEQVTAEVVREFGPPPPPRSAGDLTLEHVLDLVGHQILRIDGEDEIVALGTATPASVEALRGALRALATPGAHWSLPDDVPAGEFVAAVRRHHVTTQVTWGLERLELPPALRGRLRADAAGQLAAADQLTPSLHLALDALDEANVRTLMVKGLALSALAWGDPRARGAGDLDLFVSPADMATAHRALQAQGWKPQGGYPRPGDSWAWRWFLRTDNEAPMQGHGCTVDLHFHLVPARSTFPTFDALWSRRAMVAIEGRQVATLGRYDAFTHSAGHAAKDHWRWLRGLLDVHRLAGDPRTWAGADRPLRGDQLLSLGIAVRTLGMPDGAPEVVHEAAARAERVIAHARAAQDGRPYLDITTRVPGTGAWRVITTQWRTGASLADHARQAASLLLPPVAVAPEPSPYAVVAGPRALRRRADELVPLWRNAARRRLRSS